MQENMLKIENVSKKYKLGQIGGTTLQEELQRLGARIWHKEDPTRIIGTYEYNIGESFLALDSVSFSVKKSERVGIIGHNGAGKSTLLKLISRITAPTSGDIWLNGRVASMLEVGTGFHGELTGRENIYMNGAILGMKKKEIDAKIDDIIDFSECRQFIDTPVKRYSSGMYVKLAFSVAAHLDAEIMIMDEVLAVGDMAFQKKCLEKMNNVSRMEERTILYVSHNMNTIRQLCDRCIVLKNGKLLYDGSVENGIQKYLGTSQNLHTDVWVSDEMRQTNMRNPEIKVEHIKILCSNGMIEQGNLIPIEFLIENTCTYDRCIDIRILVDSSIGSRILMSMTEKSIRIKAKSSIKKRFRLDVSLLEPDVYHLSTVLFEQGYRADYRNIDVLKSVIHFEVSDVGLLRGGQSWKPQVWGNVFGGYLIEDI